MGRGLILRALLGAALVLGMVAGPAVAQDPGPAGGTLAWEPCEDGFECATLEVPLDHRRPRRGTIDIAVVRRPADDPAARIGSLLVNPGGPGGSGFDFALGAEGQFSPEVLARHDVVGFDPRGVARSTPITCASDAEIFPSGQPWPTETVTARDFSDASRDYARDCRAAGARLLPHLTTENTARDMDLLREALGEEQISYFGFSYGTILGAVYADLFPGRLRVGVLDGAVDPQLWFDDSLAWLEDQGLAFERNLDAFLAWCADAGDGCPFGDGDPAAAYDAYLVQLQDAPVPAAAGPDDLLDAAEFQLAVLVTFYFPAGQGYPLLAEALTLGEAGDAELLAVLSEALFPRADDGTWPQFLDAYNAVLKGDGSWPFRLRPYERQDAALAVTAPRLGRNLLWNGTIVPAYLPRSTSRIDGDDIDAAGAPTLLVIGSTGDPATPYDEAVALTGQLDDAVLLTRAGDGHVAYPYSACVRDLTDAYLLDGVVPDEGVVCATDPEFQAPATAAAAGGRTALPEMDDLRELQPALR